MNAKCIEFGLPVSKTLAMNPEFIKERLDFTPAPLPLLDLISSVSSNDPNIPNCLYIRARGIVCP